MHWVSSQPPNGGPRSDKRVERTTDINIPSQVTIKVQVRPVMETRPKVLWRKKDRSAKGVVEGGDDGLSSY